MPPSPPTPPQPPTWSNPASSTAAPSHRDAALGAVLDELDHRASGRPRAAVILAWVLAMLEDDDAVSSKEVAHAFRCEEDYVCWCCEVGVRRGDLRHVTVAWRLPGVPPPLEGWARSRLDPLARMALEAAYDEAVAARTRSTAEPGPTA